MKEHSRADCEPPGYYANSVPLQGAVVHLHAQDNVAIARTDLKEGAIVIAGATESPPVRVTVRQPIPSGHKVALEDIPASAPVRRYGQTIGFATQAIQAGDHVHSQNLGIQDFARDYAFSADVCPVASVPEGERRAFLGFKRPGGRVGTRNYVAIISSVNCSAHTSREIARHFTHERLAGFTNVDGVIALTHAYGCSVRLGGHDHVLLQRTLAGMARHPNIGACIFVGLGCEINQIDALQQKHNLCTGSGILGDCAPVLQIQELGGIRKTVHAGIEAIEGLLPQANASQRTPQPASELMVALQCGGSDGWSGITANPLVGLVADEIVRQGGTVVLSETTEVYGAEHLLTRRAVSSEVGQKLVAQVRWWEEYTRKMGIEIDNNPTPGNKAGGLTTIYEKSLGAVSKAGSTPLAGVYDHAELVTARGFTFMDGPGNDWTSVTGQVAGGCTLALFTTGRGSCFGFKPAPVIKIASNSNTYHRMTDDMDVNAGRALEGVPVEEVADELLDLIIGVASGQPSKSEAQGVGEAEFVPWQIGGTL